MSYGNVGQGFSLAYDANGNMTSKTDAAGTTNYVYDSENRLVQINMQPVTGNPQLVTYKYDPFGRRIEKNVNGMVTRYVYDREDILFELDGNGNIITEFVHGPGIDEPIAMIRGERTYYYHADGLGSIIAITDSAGNVVQRYEYNSFGEITYQQDPNFNQPYTYTGREYDDESGLYYYRARYYDAKIGRFLQQDPILSPMNPMSVGLSQLINKNVWVLPSIKSKPKSLHPYVYTNNNPVNYTDSSGLISECANKAWDLFAKCAAVSFIIIEVPFSISLAACVATGPGFPACAATVVEIYAHTETVLLSICAIMAISEYSQCKDCEK